MASNRGFKMKFAVITFPYSMDTDAGTAAGPEALLQAGLADWLREQKHALAGPFPRPINPRRRGGLWGLEQNWLGQAEATL